MDLARIEIYIQNLTYPREKAGEFFAAQLVAFSTNDDVAVFADVEVSVPESPDVEALRFIFSGCGLRLRHDQRTLGRRSATAGFLGCFCRTQTAILRENSAFSKARKREVVHHFEFEEENRASEIR